MINEENIYSPEISQIQGAEDGLTWTCVGVIPWGLQLWSQEYESGLTTESRA